MVRSIRMYPPSPLDTCTVHVLQVCTLYSLTLYIHALEEAEKILHESKIHGHIKLFMMHLHAEDKAWYLASLATDVSNKDQHEGGTGDDNDNKSDDADVADHSDHPCFDVLLQNRYMDELCSRGRQDKPR